MANYHDLFNRLFTYSMKVFEPLNNNIYNNNEYSNIKLIFKFLCLYEFEDVPYLCIEVIHHNSVYDFCPLFLLHYSYN